MADRAQLKPVTDEEQNLTTYDFGSLGTTGLKQFGGRLHEEFLLKLRGRRFYETIREMTDNSSVVGTIELVNDRLVRQVKWQTKPSDEKDPVAVAQAEFVESNRNDMSHTWEDFISEAFSFLRYGWSFHEIVYKQRKGESEESNSKYDDGKVGWRKLAPRGQDVLDRWEFDAEDDGLRGIHQADWSSGWRCFIPIEKGLLFRTQSIKNNPEAKSIYRAAVVDYFFLKRIQELEAIGVEKDMTGIPHMQVPMEMLGSGASVEEKNLVSNLEKMMGSLKRGAREYAITPSELDRDNNPTGFKFTLLQSGGQKTHDTTKIKSDYRVAILMTSLAQFLQLGLSGQGSRALFVSAADLYAVALKTYVNEIATVLNRYAIPRLLRANNMDLTKAPTICAGDVVAPSLEEVVGIILKLSQAQQLLPDQREITNTILERASLPRLPEIEVAPPATDDAE